MSDDNLEIWKRLATPPPEALKTIEAGRLKGKSDINPQWRYEAMTAEFGPCGFGWKPVIKRLWSEPVNDGQVFAFAEIDVYVKKDGEWSEPVPGLGGSMLVEQERSGLHASDEGYKMAVTDALGTAMKLLGLAADVYRGNYDGSKYRKTSTTPPQNPPQGAPPPQTPPQAPTSEPKDAEYQGRVRMALQAIYGDDIAKKKAKIKELTTFTGKDGKTVDGVEDYRPLKGKRLEILCHKLEALAPTKQVCAECQGPIERGACRNVQCPEGKPYDDIPQ